MKFLVYNKGKINKNFDLLGAYVFGNDGIAIRRVEINFEDGIIECKKPHQSTSGLAILWPVEGFGKVILPTTCLPEREQPYILNVEIARAKLMQIINKCEDWSIFSSPVVLAQLLKQAQELFISAIQNISNTARASHLADESLKASMDFSEKLAVRQAVTSFNAKSSSHGFSRGCLGCQVDFEHINEPAYIEKLMELFGFAMLPVKWSLLEPQKGNYDFSLIDESINALSKKKLAISAGPLLCFSQDSLPDWLLSDRKADFEKIRESAYQFVVTMLNRYSDRIRSWVVISGLNMYNHFRFNFEQVLEMTRAATMAVKSVSNRVLKIIEISDPWGEYYSQLENAIPPLVYIDMIMQSGISFDAFGFQIKFGKNESGMRLRDLMSVSANLDKLSFLGKALYITGVEVPSSLDSEQSEFSGMWHGRWDEELQGQWIEQFYKIALSKPVVDCVVYSHLTDCDGSRISNSGLMNRNFEPKRSYIVMKKLHDVIFSH